MFVKRINSPPLLISKTAFFLIVCSFIASLTTMPAYGEDTSSLITKFDWRNKHSAMNSSSPYHEPETSNDLDVTKNGVKHHNGWMTKVKEQSCNHCWSFAAVGTTEAFVNLYFNSHINLDLSEQQVATCSDGNANRNCDYGGLLFIDGAKKGSLEYIMQDGAVDEQCSLYTGDFAPCASQCSNPSERIQISGINNIMQAMASLRTDAEKVELIKRELIEKGPIAGCAYAEKPDPNSNVAGHCTVLVGFDQHPVTGETIWVYKNSYGPYTEPKDYEMTTYGPGYGGAILPIERAMYLYQPEIPIIDMNNRDIACNDFDGDGYYNWGLSEQMPDTCEAGTPAEKDCDDSDPNAFHMNKNGHCLKMCQSVSDCDDGDDCTNDICTENGCEHTPIPNCGECLSVTNTISELMKDRYVYEQCFFMCRYYATGSGQNLGTDSSRVVTLYSRKNSFVWSTEQCTSSSGGNPVCADIGERCRADSDCCEENCVFRRCR